VAAPDDQSPFPVQARAEEEDTYLVLSAPTTGVRQAEHPIRLMTALWDVDPLEPGSVVVKPGNPLRLLAVVHDLDLDPTCKEDWVAQAMGGIRQEVLSRGITSLALPLIGCIHGRLPADLFAGLLSVWFRQESALPLKRLWLVAEPDQGQVVLEELARS
jgi:hypothetical protein